MSYVEYVQIFISLVYGLAFTRIITSYAIIIKHYSKIKFYWPYFPLSLGLLIFVINDFWTGFERNKFLEIGTGLSLKLTFISALVTPISYTIVAEMLHPKIKHETFDMSDLRTARKIGYTTGMINILYTFTRSISTNQNSSTLTAEFIRIIIFSIFIVGVFSKNELIQKWIAVFFFLLSVVWFLSENNI